MHIAANAMNYADSVLLATTSCSLTWMARRHRLGRKVESHASSGTESAGFVSELPLSGGADDTFFTIAEHPPQDHLAAWRQARDIRWEELLSAR